MAEKEKINPVTLDIVKDSLIAVSNEIFYAFAQTSMSPIIYETLDYASIYYQRSVYGRRNPYVRCWNGNAYILS